MTLLHDGEIIRLMTTNLQQPVALYVRQEGAELSTAVIELTADEQERAARLLRREGAVVLLRDVRMAA